MISAEVWTAEDVVVLMVIMRGRYNVMDKLFDAASEIFPDSYLHLGGTNTTILALHSNVRLLTSIVNSNKNLNQLLAAFIHDRGRG